MPETRPSESTTANTEFAKPFCSFVVPTLGRKTLQRTIDSIEAQHNPSWDCYIEKDTQKSAGRTRNKALPKIKTPWVAFVDDDDAVAPDYVDRLIEESGDCGCIIWRMLHPRLGIFPRHHKLEWGNQGVHYAIKTELFRKFPFVKQRNQDFFQLIQIENAGYKIKWSDHLVYYARTQPPKRPKEI